MAKDRDPHESLFHRAKKPKRPGDEDPRKARYAELAARTAHKYDQIAKSRGVPVSSKKK
jgi:hypothetical protein